MKQPELKSTLFTDSDDNPIVGFCLWCGCDFYTIDQHAAHIANDSAACAVFQKLKDQHRMPPVLQASFEGMDFTDSGSKDGD